MRINTHLIKCIIVITIGSLYSKAHGQTQEQNDSIQQDTVKYTPSKTVYYLDGKQVSESLIYRMAPKGELSEGRGFTTPKDAIRFYGEKYRYGGIIWFNSKK